ncbi:MAG: TfoX/Sxy family protein [Candidatus Thermoplasmatota archaeon]|jgi:DNA transformation protein|nr:TfoX/Sxy family protein [Candidatus Thermoplasmatota archaeon]MDP7265065.1 TfoX/Sxy family protein [Candidatus Thermoplasmatota archaeon]
MAVDQGYLDYVTEKLEGLEDLTVKKMFGGAGLFSGGKMFALIYGGTLYFKIGESNEEDYVKKGSQPFIPPFGKRRMKMPYYVVPADILDDTDKILEWAERSVKIALARK